MARRLIIDDRTGVLYEDFTARRIASLDEFFNAEAGATESVDVFSVNVNPQTRAVTANTILTGNVSLDIGVPRAKPTGGKITVTYGADTSGELSIETLTAETLSSALNRLDAMETAGGCDVWRAGDDDSELSFYVRLQNNGAPGTNPSFDCDGATPPAIGEVTVVKTGSSSERALWLINLAEKPVASIAESAWSTVTSGSFGGLTASLALNGAGLLAHLSKEDPGDLTLTVKNSSSALYRGTLRAFPAVDPNDLNGSSIHAIFPQIVTSGSNPTVNDDTNDGYGVGTLWINTSTPSAFLLMANGAGAANWDEITETGTGQLLAANNLSDLANASTARTNLGAQATITGAATTIDTENLTASRALASNASGKIEVSAVTSTELGYLDGVTSAIQTQLDAKQAQPSEGAFANGDKTKLDAIESGADVTDATNVSAAGALMKSGGTMTGALTLGSGGLDASYNTLSNVSDGSSTQDAVTKGQLDSVNTTATAALPKTGGTMSGAIAMGSSKITGLAEGTANGDALRFEQLRTIKNDVTDTTYTLVIGDATKTVRLNNASTVMVTVPKSVFVAGDTVTLFRKGAGGVTISPVDSDVTINSVGTKRKLASQYSAATLICVTGWDTPEFDLIGDLIA